MAVGVKSGVWNDQAWGLMWPSVWLFIKLLNKIIILGHNRPNKDGWLLKIGVIYDLWDQMWPKP